MIGFSTKTNSLQTNVRPVWQDTAPAPSPAPTLLDETQATSWGVMSTSSVFVEKSSLNKQI